MISATYDDSLARVRISVTDLATSTVERSLDGVHWEFVRGMSEATTAPFLVVGMKSPAAPAVASSRSRDVLILWS